MRNLLNKPSIHCDWNPCLGDENRRVHEIVACWILDFKNVFKSKHTIVS